MVVKMVIKRKNWIVIFAAFEFELIVMKLLNASFLQSYEAEEGSGIDLSMMCGVTQEKMLPPCAQLSITLSHTCTPRPSCFLPFTVSSVVCPHRCESLLFFSPLSLSSCQNPQPHCAPFLP